MFLAIEPSTIVTVFFQYFVKFFVYFVCSVTVRTKCPRMDLVKFVVSDFF